MQALQAIGKTTKGQKLLKKLLSILIPSSGFNKVLNHLCRAGPIHQQSSRTYLLTRWIRTAVLHRTACRYFLLLTYRCLKACQEGVSPPYKDEHYTIISQTDIKSKECCEEILQELNFIGQALSKQFHATQNTNSRSGKQ